MSVLQRLKAARMTACPLSMPLPELPHLTTIDHCTSEEQVREQVERTIADCEAVAKDLERQLEQRYFIVSFLRDFLDRPPSPLAESRDRAPVAPMRLRRRARQSELAANDQLSQVSVQGAAK